MENGAHNLSEVAELMTVGELQTFMDDPTPGQVSG